MIEVSSVTKKFGDFTAIQDLSLTVPKGAIYGLVGYNGAGKTTLLKTVSGVYKPEGGEVRINGENVFDNAKQKAKMFYVPDDLYFQPYASMDKMAHFYDGYYANFDMDEFKKLASIFGLNTTKRINGFSKGMQRQAEIVLAMSTNPEIILLDESFDGLDPQKRAIIKNLLHEYMAEREVSIIISSHNLHELEDLCDHIGLINGKSIALDGSVAELSKDKAKFRLLFDHPVTREDFTTVKLHTFEEDGRLLTIFADGNVDEVKAQLEAMNPLLLERRNLTLEEIFLDEMEGLDYDFSQIFS